MVMFTVTESSFNLFPSTVQVVHYSVAVLYSTVTFLAALTHHFTNIFTFLHGTLFITKHASINVHQKI